MEVLGTLTMVYQTRVPLEPKCGLLDILSDTIPEEPTQMAFNRALFQAQKTILLLWKSSNLPSHQLWVTYMGKKPFYLKGMFINIGDALENLKD